MPTSLPTARSRRQKLDMFLVFVIALGISFVTIELVDPMPMDVEAALAVSAP